MSCRGLHCNGCGDGGGGAVALAVVVVLILIGAMAKPLEHAVRTASHILTVALEVVIIGLAVLAASAVATVLTWAGVRLYRRYTNRPAAADRRSLDQPIRVVAEVVQAEPQAIEGPKPRISGVDGLVLADSPPSER